MSGQAGEQEGGRVEGRWGREGGRSSEQEGGRVEGKREVGGGGGGREGWVGGWEGNV